jgi:hypothetical protein
MLSLDASSDIREPLEDFVAACLMDAGHWSSRESDGVSSYRVIEHSPTRLCVGGRIWTIDQKLHSFWLDVRGGHDEVAWALCFDVDEAAVGKRMARHAVDAIRSSEEVPWVVNLGGS